jgi:ADP/ATP carrier protein family
LPGNTNSLKKYSLSYYFWWLWPIHKKELREFIPMALMMFCLLFNFSTLRSVKDSLVVAEIGAEVISFLKFWIVLPSAIGFTILYGALTNIFNTKTVFEIILSGFIIFFAAFAFIIYPNEELYHPSKEAIEHYAKLHPHFKWFIKIAGKWSYGLIYIVGELWSGIIINLLFWQLANQITGTDEAKRFYPIYGMVGSFGLILSGSSLKYFSGTGNLPEGMLDYLAKSGPYQANEATLKLTLSAIIISCLITLILHNYIHRDIKKRQKSIKQASHKQPSIKNKLGLAESAKLIFSSKYLLKIVTLVICYGFVINIVEGPWKSKIGEQFSTFSEYLGFLGNFNIAMGIASVSFVVIGSNILRYTSWRFAALITPLTVLVTGSMFFIFAIWESDLRSILLFSPLYGAIIVGAAQNVLSKASKYSLFDSTKEMAYIPLDQELKTKGKAAVEIIGTKFGKSLGAILQFMIFILFPDAKFDDVLGLLFVIFILVSIVWLVDVNSLAGSYQSQLKYSGNND